MFLYSLKYILKSIVYFYKELTTEVLIAIFHLCITDAQQQQHFAAGYNECAREVQMYLLRSNDVSPQVKARMLSHISTSPPDMSSSKPSMNYPMKREEPLYKANNTFPPLISVYPSPPSSPTGLGHIRINLKSPSESQWVPMCTSNDNRSANTTINRKDDSPSQELWRPWQSI